MVRGSRVKILALCADPGVRLDAVKGATIHVTELWRALARAQAQVTGVAPCGPGAIPELPGVEVHAVPVTGPGDLPARVLTAALSAAARGPAPDAVLERLALDSEAGLELARRLGVPLIVEINSPLDEEARRFRGRELTAETTARQARLLAAAEIVYVVSDALSDYAIRRGADPARVRVLPNGVDVAAFDRPRIAADPAGPVRGGFVGTFRPWHGLELVVEALAQARGRGANVELELVGDGPLRAGLEGDVTARGLSPHVRFEGARTHAEVAEFLRHVDIAIVAAPDALDYYFSPLKIYEYAAAGCAILAPRAGQVAARFVHGEDAFLVSPGDAAGLADGLVQLAEDPALRERLGAAARQRARREFDWSGVARAILGWVARPRALPGERC